MPNDRNTRFAGIAKLLASEMVYSNRPDVSSTEEFFAKWEQTIARRAYDLMRHVLANTNSFEFGMYGDDYVIEKIPDMTEWPKESE